MGKWDAAVEKCSSSSPCFGPANRMHNIQTDGRRVHPRLNMGVTLINKRSGGTEPQLCAVWGSPNQPWVEGSVFYNPLPYFPLPLRTAIIQKMTGEGGYSQNYSSDYMLSFDNRFQGSRYWFWGDGCERMAGIAIKPSFVHKPIIDLP